MTFQFSTINNVGFCFVHRPHIVVNFVLVSKNKHFLYFFKIRESPDGGNSSVVDGWKSGSGRASVAFDCDALKCDAPSCVAFDCDDAMTTGSSGDGLERDIIMEFVLQEEMENKNRFIFAIILFKIWF